MPNCWEELKQVRDEIEALKIRVVELKKTEKNLITACEHYIGYGGRSIDNGMVTKTEKKVLAALIEYPFFQNKEIASHLGLSLRAIKYHISNLLCKYAVKNRIELIEEVREKQ